jgi:uncharacterized protein YfaS (alpha-2-macroglobulin family)
MPHDEYHVLEYVDAYLHEAVTPQYAGYLEEHCEQCAMCRAALDEARRRHAALDSVAAAEASEQLIQATVQRIERIDAQRTRTRRRLSWSFLTAAAASLLILAGAHAYFWRMSPAPYDVRVYGQNQLYAAANGSVRVRVVNQKTGEPVAGAPVAIELRGQGNQSVQLATFQTNAQGTGQPLFQMPDWPDGDYELRIVARPNGDTQTLTQPVKLKRSWKIMLSSDKPVYQPGQKIQLRSLSLLRPTLRPFAGHAATFAISDPKGNIIFKRKDVTSEHGIAAVDCQLADEVIEGPYSIACKVGDTESKLTVEVKKYVRPKFKIEVKDLEPYYRPGQRVSGTVQAIYFAGEVPVADADVKIKALTAGVGGQPLKELEAKTAPDGTAKFEFVLPESLVGRPQDSGDARFALEIAVEDPAGQKQTKMASRVVTAEPLRLEIIPEGGTLVQGMANKVYAFVSRADGNPAAGARVRVTGVEKELTANKVGVTSFPVTPSAAQVELTIAGNDKENRVSKTVTLTCGQPQQDFILRTDKAVYNGGETVHLTALGGGVEPIFVDFLKDGQTILTETIDVQAGRGEYHFDLPPDVFGTLELVAYRFASQPRTYVPPNATYGVVTGGGLPVRKSRILYVRPAQQLKIAAKLDRAEYRPKQKGNILFSITDADGKPAPGALSVAAVDEAVFAVLDQAPGMERTFYLLEQQLLQPVYAVYAWSPDLASAVPAQDRIELEQALFSKTARTMTDADLGGGAADGRRRGEPRIAMAPPGGGGNLADSPHTMVARSFPVQAEQVERTRDGGLWWVKRGWITFVAVLLVSGLISLWVLAEPRPSVSSIFGGPEYQQASVQPLPGETPERSAGHGSNLVIWGLVAFLAIVVFLASITTIGQNANKTFRTVGMSLGAGDQGEVAAMAPGGRAGNADMALRDPAVDGQPAKNAPPPPAEGGGGGEQQETIRVRERFLETLLWQPQLITDKDGTCTLPVEFSDDITTWRLSASAVTTDGRLGALQTSIRVFQPFFVDVNLPPTLTRNDEIALPVVVTNQLGKPQTVKLTVAPADWFVLMDDAEKSLELPAKAVRSLSFRVRVTKVGKRPLEIKAVGTGVADAIKKEIEVVPDGLRQESVHSGLLNGPVAHTLNLPAQGVIEGSPRAILKIYPSSFSQLVEGLDNIFQMPHGCFEQTSSTTYPNVLALDYLKRTGKKSKDVEARARQYIHTGYQRLVSFEVRGGGFDWFGRPPANVRLTAYGLMEFEDMAKVYDVDPKLIERTRQWLLSKRGADGSWAPAHGLHEEADPARGQQGDMAKLASTAYVAWAVFGSQPSHPDASRTLQYLQSFQVSEISDPYVLALTCNALLALDSSGTSAAPFVARLDALKTVPDNKHVFWQQAAGGHTTFYGAGRSGDIETTSLAVLALVRANKFAGSARGGLTWIAEQKDANGTWHSTQATVLALKALLAGTGKTLGGEKERVIAVAFNNKKHTIKVSPDQADVMQQVDLKEIAELKPGENSLALEETTGTGSGYQVAFRYHVEGTAAVNKDEPLSIAISYDKTELQEGGVVIATATVTARQTAPMVILDLPIPAGFELTPDQLAELRGSKLIEKYQITPRQAIIYLRDVQPGKPLTLRYDLKAKMPVKVAVPAARAYEYYNPDKQGFSAPSQMTVTPRK